MAIVLEANYSKKLGLPGYSSHQYMVSVRTELTDMDQVADESARLYRQLQESVDMEIQNPGWLPSSEGAPSLPAHNGSTNGTNGHAHWNCSAKQEELIRKIVLENGLELTVLQNLAQQRFGKSLQLLNKLEASGLLSELLDSYGGRSNGSRNGHNGNSNGQRKPDYAGGRR